MIKKFIRKERVNKERNDFSFSKLSVEWKHVRKKEKEKVV